MDGIKVWSAEGRGVGSRTLSGQNRSDRSTAPSNCWGLRDICILQMQVQVLLVAFFSESPKNPGCPQTEEDTTHEH